MTLGQKQRQFAIKLAKHIQWLYSMGYEVSLGDAFRDPRVHGKFGEDVDAPYGHSKSFHKKKLAQDLNLFKDGKYLSSTEAHRFSGEKWKQRGGTWGGDFEEPDGNHYSWGEGR